MAMIEHLWLITGLVAGIGNAVIFKFHSRTHIARGHISKDEANKLILGWLFWISVPCLIFWTLQPEIDTPKMVIFMFWAPPNQYYAIALMLALWTTLLVWVFRFKGASALIKLGMLSNSGKGDFRPSTRQVKVMVSLCVASGIAAMVLANQLFR